ncbi:hypothetical protein HK105_208308 [Polyrhizophydium stewartii]|uniref:TmcB/TmcC TPR repeats domain-containing protein n=1 Tax=Polyrhizophydium stewartii TaxID=2732419 RepID=A0ABR4MY80_9FUNG
MSEFSTGIISSNGSGSGSNQGNGEDATSKNLSASKQDMLQPFWRSQYSFCSVLINHATLFDWIAWPSTLAGDVSVAAWCLMPSMTSAYAIPRSVLIDPSSKALDEQKEWPAYVVLTSIFVILLLLPVCLSWGLAYQAAIYFTAFMFDSDPTKKNPWNVYNPRLDLLLVCLKTILILVSVVASSTAVIMRAIIGTAVPLVMLVLHNIFYPHYNLYLTQMVGAAGIGIAAWSTNTGANVPSGLIIMGLLFVAGIPIGYFATEFPNNAYVMSSFVQYLQKVMKNTKSALRVANKIDILRTYPDTQFQIYMILETQQKDKELQFLDVSTTMDISTLNEYSRIILDTKLNHFLSLHYTRLLWKVVIDKKYSTSRLESIAEQLQLSINKAEDGYNKLIERSRVLRYYSYFCLWTLNDDLKANRLLLEADNRERIKDAMTARGNGKKDRTAFTDAAVAKPSSGAKLGSEEKRAKEYKLLRTKLLKRNSGDIRTLLLATTVIGIIATTVLITAHTIAINQKIDYVTSREINDVYTPLVWRRIRSLESAYLNNDLTTFVTLQSSLYSIAVTMKKSVDSNFANKDSSIGIPGIGSPFQDAWVNLTIAFYPEFNGSVQFQASLYDVGRVLANSAMALSGLDFWQFNPALLQSNNDFCVFADNWYWLDKTAWLFQNYVASFSYATTLIYGLLAVHIGIFAIFIVILDVVLVHRFRKKQSEMLEAFRCLPMSVKNEKLTALEEAQQDDILDFEQTFANTSAASDSRLRKRSFRNEYIAYTVATIALALTFSIMSAKNISELSNNMALLDQIMHIRLQTTRAVNLVQELSWADWTTWGSKDNLLTEIAETTAEVREAYEHVVFGDPKRNPPTGPAYTYLDAADFSLGNMWCLAKDEAACRSRRFDVSIGYTQDLVGHGVIHLQDSIMPIINVFNKAASNGTYVSDPASAALLDKVLEPDLLDGWAQEYQLLLEHTRDYVQHATEIDDWLLFAEILTIFVGQFIVFTRMINYFQFLDRCNVELLVRLPREVRRLPDFTRFITEQVSGARRSQFGTFVATIRMYLGIHHRSAHPEDHDDILKQLRRKSIASKSIQKN